MQIGNFSKLGWVVAGALGAIMLAGFQGPTDKTGVVDLNVLIKTSESGKAAMALLTQMQDSRKAILLFMNDNRGLTEDQAKKLKELWCLPAPTDAQKADLDKLKADIVLSKTKNNELAQKSNPSAEEKAFLNDYATRSRATQEMLPELDQSFQTELRSSLEKQQTAVVEKARAAIKETAKAQGYTVVFDSQVAIFGANDITDAALKTMNAKK